MNGMEVEILGNVEGQMNKGEKAFMTKSDTMAWCLELKSNYMRGKYFGPSNGELDISKYLLFWSRRTLKSDSRDGGLEQKWIF